MPKVTWRLVSPPSVELEIFFCSRQCDPPPTEAASNLLVSQSHVGRRGRTVVASCVISSNACLNHNDAIEFYDSLPSFQPFIRPVDNSGQLRQELASS